MKSLNLIERKEEDRSADKLELTFDDCYMTTVGDSEKDKEKDLYSDL